jgi:hypothetical protein
MRKAEILDGSFKISGFSVTYAGRPSEKLADFKDLLKTKDKTKPSRHEKIKKEIQNIIGR